MEIKQVVQENWPVTVETIEVLKQSGERVVYKVTTDKGSFTFKIADPSKSRKDVANDTSIFQFLEDQNFPAPRILKTSDQKNFIKVEDKYIYALTYLEGETPDPTIENYRKLGDLTARLHKLKGYKIRTKFTPASQKPYFAEKEEKFGERYSALVKSLPTFTGYPECLIHTDIGLHNSVQLKNGDIVLVDWDDAGVGTRILDIGFPLLSSFTSDSLDYQINESQAYYSTYLSEIRLTKEEKQHIWDAGLFFALMYFPTQNGQADW